MGDCWAAITIFISFVEVLYKRNTISRLIFKDITTMTKLFLFVINCKYLDDYCNAFEIIFAKPTFIAIICLTEI